MHRLLAGVTILEHELSALRLLVERQTGILLDCPNSALAAHIADYLERTELESPAALLARFRSAELEPCEMTGFLDGIMNVSTGFFRHPGAMTALGRQVVPQILARKVSEGPATLRIWSAGCGSGEEPYSIAMAICEALGSNNASSAGNGNGSNGSKDAKCRPQWRHLRKLSACKQQWLQQGMLDPYRGHGPVAFRDSGRRARGISAVGRDGPAAGNHSSLLLENRSKRIRWDSGWEWQWNQRCICEREWKRVSAGEAASPQPGDIQHHEPDEASLYRALRLHLLHGRVAASVAQPSAPH